MRLIACVAALLALCCACEIDATVEVHLDRDGTGTVVAKVTLDADAHERIVRLGGGDTDLGAALAVDDLAEQGWAVEGPTVTSDGGVEVSLSASFDSPEQAARLVAELSGDSGLVTDVAVEDDEGSLQQSQSVSLRASMASVDVGLVGDSELVESLEKISVDPAAIQSELQRDLEEALALTVIASVDGDTDSRTVVAGESATAEASGSWVLYDQVAWLGAAALLAIAGVVAVGLAVVRRGPRQRAGRGSSGEGADQPSQL